MPKFLAYTSPNRSILSDFDCNIDSGRMIAIIMANNNSWSLETLAKLPNPQITYARISSSTLRYFNTPIMALAMCPIITPMMSSVTLPRTCCDTNTTNAITQSEPIIADMVIAISPTVPMLHKATPAKFPESNTANATPKLAPELMPKTDGPAIGLRNIVCI